MSRTSDLIVAAIGPELAGSVFGDAQTGEPAADVDVPVGVDWLPSGRASGVLWCAATDEFLARHPSAREAIDDDHPLGCTDLSVRVDDNGLLGDASLEMLALDEGLVGRPLEEVLPAIAARVRAVLTRDSCG